MVTIVHGDDTTASRTFFIAAKKRASQPITLEVDQVTITDITQLLSGGGLFQETKAIFIESLLTKKKKSNELMAIMTILARDELANVYLWEGKEIDKKTLALYTGVKSQMFTLPKSLFLLLDNIKPRNPALIKLFHTTIDQVEVEMVFFMLIRQLRLLLAVSARDGEIIEELKRMPPWQRQKLEKQARLFKPGIIRQKYQELYDIDRAQKTGQLPTSLSAVIDFWILEI